MRTETTDHEARLTELESRLAFQEQTIEELHEVLYRQQGQIDLMTMELGRLRRRLLQMDPEAGETDGRG